MEKGASTYDMIKQEILDLIRNNKANLEFLTEFPSNRFDIQDESGMMLFRVLPWEDNYRIVYSYYRVDKHFRDKYGVNSDDINLIVSDVILNKLNIKALVFCQDEVDAMMDEPTYNNPRYYNRQKIYDKAYVLKYSKGSHEDYVEVNLFVTTNKYDAVQYRDKFNKILRRYKEFYETFEYKEFGHTYLKKEFFAHRTKWLKINEINECYFDEVDFR